METTENVTPAEIVSDKTKVIISPDKPLWLYVNVSDTDYENDGNFVQIGEAESIKIYRSSPGANQVIYGLNKSEITTSIENENVPEKIYNSIMNGLYSAFIFSEKNDPSFDGEITNICLRLVVDDNQLLSALEISGFSPVLSVRKRLKPFWPVDYVKIVFDSGELNLDADAYKNQTDNCTICSSWNSLKYYNIVSLLSQI